MQWAVWDGVRQFEKKNHDYLQGQIGNPEGEDKPNKKFYDPRAWIRKSEEAAVERLGEAFSDLNSDGVLTPQWIVSAVGVEAVNVRTSATLAS